MEQQTVSDTIDDWIHVRDDRTPGSSDECAGFGEPLDQKRVISWQQDILASEKVCRENAWRNGLLVLTTMAYPDPAGFPGPGVAKQQVFNTRISLEASPIEAQGKTGRCWIFAVENIFRVALMQKYNLESIQLSGNYLFFWDKMEKANYFMDQILECSGRDLTDRLVQSLLDEPIVDGAQWQMAINLVEKYGLVPESAYPDTHSAADSGTLNYIIDSQLRASAMKLRQLAAGGGEAAVMSAAISQEKSRTLRKVCEILLVALGPPPQPDRRMTWDYYDKRGEYHKLTISPLELAGQVSYLPVTRSFDRRAFGALPPAPLCDMYSLMNDPRHAYGELLTIPRRGNVVGGAPIRHMNVEMSILKRASIHMIRQNMPVYFACDARPFVDRPSGIMDLDVYAFGLAFDVQVPSLDKATRLLTKDSRPTHVMVMTAVHVDDDDRPVRWRCQNSWGTEVGADGFFVMSDRWMDEYVTQVVAHPGAVPPWLGDILKKEPIELETWDPMASIA